MLDLEFYLKQITCLEFLIFTIIVEQIQYRYCKPTIIQYKEKCDKI